MFDINNAREAPADIEVDDDLFAIVEQYWNWINNAPNWHHTDGRTGQEREEFYGVYGGLYSHFLAQGGTRAQWVQYLAMLNGNLSSPDTKVKYNEAIIDLCEANPGYVKVLDGNLCSNSGEVMFLGNQRVALQDNCDPRALADGINTQNSDYRAICGEPTKEEVNCVITVAVYNR